MILQSGLYIIGVRVAHFRSVTLGVAANASLSFSENWGRIESSGTISDNLLNYEHELHYES